MVKRDLNGERTKRIKKNWNSHLVRIIDQMLMPNIT